MADDVDPWMKLFQWRKPDRPTAFDTNTNCVGFLPELKKRGFDTAIRYYDHTVEQPHPSKKCLSAPEAVQVLAAGFNLVAVFEASDKLEFGVGKGGKNGVRHGKWAGHYATTKIHQPMGSAIYFAVDLDLDGGEIKRSILPYFKGVLEGLKATCPGGIPYRVGVYGSGDCCKAVLDAGLARYAWLAGARRWSGFKTFETSGRWHLKQEAQTHLGKSFGFDPDFVNARDIGQFDRRDIFL